MALIEFDEDLGKRLAEDEFARKWVQDRFRQMDSYRKAWESGWQQDWDQFSSEMAWEKDDWQSRLFIPRTYSTIATIVPRLVAGMFGAQPWFALKPLYPEQAATIKLRERVLEEQAENATHLRRLASEEWYYDVMIFGNSPTMTVWDFETQKPRTTKLDIFDWWGDQRARRPSEMRDGMHRVRTTIDEIRRLAGAGVYRPDVVNQIKEAAKEDAVQERLQGLGRDESNIRDLRAVDLYEYWGYGRVITVTTDFRLLLRNEPDELYGGKDLPYVLGRCIPTSGSLYWRSLPWAFRSLQDEQNDLRNLGMDCAKLAAGPVFAAPYDLDLRLATVYPGAVWRMADPSLLKAIQIPDVSAGLMAQAMQVARDMDSTAGVFEYTRGERSKAGETASGINAILQEANQRFAHQLDLIADPTLDHIRRYDRLNQMHLKLPAQVRVYSDQGTEFVSLSEGDYAGDVEVTISSAGVLGNRDVVRQARLNYLQLIANIPQLAERADWDGLFRMINDTMDIPSAYRVRLTPEEQQAQQLQQMQQQLQQQMLQGGGLAGGPPGAGPAPGAVPVPGGPPNNGTAMSAPMPVPGPGGATAGRRPAM